MAKQLMPHPRPILAWVKVQSSAEGVWKKWDPDIINVEDILCPRY